MEEKRNLVLAQKLNEKTLFDGFFSVIVRGVQRVGKTSYVCKSLALANGEWEWNPEPNCVKPDYESVKPWLVFKPKEFIDVVMDTDKKEKCIIWDDAGYRTP